MVRRKWVGHRRTGVRMSDVLVMAGVWLPSRANEFEHYRKQGQFFRGGRSQCRRDNAEHGSCERYSWLTEQDTV